MPAVCSTRYTFLSIARLAEMGAPSRTETSLLSVFCNENVRAALSYVRACCHACPGPIAPSHTTSGYWLRVGGVNRGKSHNLSTLAYGTLVGTKLCPFNCDSGRECPPAIY